MANRANKRNHARARRIVLWSVAVFCLTQIVGGLLLDYRWPELRFPSAAGVFEQIQKQPRPPDILCVGSSRFGSAFAQDQIRTEMRDHTGDDELTAFNAAIEGGDLVAARFIVDRILQLGMQPRLIVVEVTPETVAKRNEWLGQQAIRQLNWEDLTLQTVVDLTRGGHLGRWLAARLLPLHVHRRQICLQVYDSAERCYVQQFRPDKPIKHQRKKPLPPTQGVPWEVFLQLGGGGDPSTRTYVGLNVFRRWLREYEVGGGSAQALESLVSRCRQENIEVLLIGTPLASQHRGLYTEQINAAFLTYMQRLTERYDCRFADYRDRVPDSMFLDNHHTLREGAAYFSDLLTREQLLPLWRERVQQPGAIAASGRRPRSTVRP